MSEQQKMDQEQAAFEAFWHDESSVELRKSCARGWAQYIWQARASLPVGVPDGYMPIPTAEQIADALDGVRCYHDMSAELIAPELLANLLASTTVKAEQADEAKRIDKQCRDDVAAALGFVSGGNFAWSYLLTQIKECVRVAEAPSLPAAGLADLTAVRCQCCATEYPHDSYDAGFIAGSGMCQVCDAAMPPKDLPAAGSAVEDGPDITTKHGYPAYSVAQHNRIVAALSAQQSAPERVSVPKRQTLNNLARDGELIASGWNACLDEFSKLNPSIEQVSSLLEWAVSRWEAEVSLRPLHNVHRRPLDDTWRQVIRRIGGDDKALCGPSHDELIASHAEGGKV